MISHYQQRKNMLVSYELMSMGFLTDSGVSVEVAEGVHLLIRLRAFSDEEYYALQKAGPQEPAAALRASGRYRAL